jgi:hypothetical protein
VLSCQTITARAVIGTPPWIRSQIIFRRVGMISLSNMYYGSAEGETALPLSSETLKGRRCSRIAPTALPAIRPLLELRLLELRLLLLGAGVPELLELLHGHRRSGSDRYFLSSTMEFSSSDIICPFRLVCYWLASSASRQPVLLPCTHHPGNDLSHVSSLVLNTMTSESRPRWYPDTTRGFKAFCG